MMGFFCNYEDLFILFGIYEIRNVVTLSLYCKPLGGYVASAAEQPYVVKRLGLFSVTLLQWILMNDIVEDCYKFTWFYQSDNRCL